MRMIGIGLMAFLLAGVALLLSTMDLWETGRRYVSEITNGPQLVFENRSAFNSDAAATAVILRSSPDHSIILSGLPAYQGATFHMPIDARPTSGHLQIDATFQVLQGVNGVLRISIDNTRRAEMLLRPGEVGRSLQVLLTPSELAREQLVVSFSLQGDGPHSNCSTDPGFQAVVEIETTSAIFLNLDRPLHSARDRMSAWGHTVRVAWPDWLKTEDRLRRLVLATDLKRRNLNTAFVDAHFEDALTTMELRDLLPGLNTVRTPQKLSVGPHSIALSDANFGLRRFYRTTTWRERYDLRDGSVRRIPKMFELSLSLGKQTSGRTWFVTVLLNNQLLHQEILREGVIEHRVSINLPKEMHTAVNVIEVTASAMYERKGQCDVGPKLIAEMRPETRLITSETDFLDRLIDLRTALAQDGNLRVGITKHLTAVDATVASHLLAYVVPDTVTLRPGFSVANVVVLTPRGAADLRLDQSKAWLVYKDPSNQELVIETAQAPSGAHRSNTTLLISLSDITLAELSI